MFQGVEVEGAGSAVPGSTGWQPNRRNAQIEAHTFAAIRSPRYAIYSIFVTPWHNRARPRVIASAEA